MSRHLITGGAGFIGAALAHRLVREGHAVTVLDRFSRGKAERLPKEARTIRADIRNEYFVKQACQDQDVIWHLAYIQGTQTFYAEPREVLDVALRGIVNTLQGAERAQADFFLVSSSEVYQEPPGFPTDETVPLIVPDVMNPRYSYGGGKIACELATLAADLPRAVIVRPHNVYGPDMGRDHVIPQFALRMRDLDGDEFHTQGTGLETRSFCYIEDCIDALGALYEKGQHREVYHLGNPDEEYAINDLALKVAGWFGREVTVVPGELPKGSPTRRLPDIGKLASLGFKPRVSLDEGLDPTLGWYASL